MDGGKQVERGCGGGQWHPIQGHHGGNRGEAQQAQARENELRPAVDQREGGGVALGQGCHGTGHHECAAGPAKCTDDDARGVDMGNLRAVATGLWSRGVEGHTALFSLDFQGETHRGGSNEQKKLIRPKTHSGKACPFLPLFIHSNDIIQQVTTKDNFLFSGCPLLSCFLNINARVRPAPSCVLRL